LIQVQQEEKPLASSSAAQAPLAINVSGQPENSSMLILNPA